MLSTSIPAVRDAAMLPLAPPLAPALPAVASGDRITLSAAASSPPARAPGGPSPPVIRVKAARVPGTLEEQAVRDNEQQADVLRADEIHARMAAERKLSQARIDAIMTDLQTEVLRVWQEVLLRRQKVMADLLDKWSKVMFG